MTVVDSVKADERLRHRPSVASSHPGGSRRDAAPGRMPSTGQTLRVSALRCTAYFLPVHGACGAGVIIAFLIGSVVVRRRGLTAQRRGRSAVGGTAVTARLQPGVRVAALLRPAAIRFRIVIETTGKLHHEAGGPGASDPSTGLPLDSIFIEGRGNSLLV